MSRDIWLVGVGTRAGWIADEGYDPFATTDTLAQIHLAGTRTLLVRRNASLAAGIAWEYGERSANARGARSELGVHRLGALLQGRYHLDRDLFALVGVGPHALHLSASLDEQSAPAKLEDGRWGFGLDATGGVAWNVPRSLGAPNTLPEMWISGELGYGWATRRDLVLRPALEQSDPRSNTALALGSLALRGVMMRIAVSAAF
jgi:hypothetical protein